MRHFHTSGLDLEQMVQWFLIDWSFVPEDGSSLCKTISKVTCLMSAAEMFGWFCSAGCLCWVTGRLQMVLDAMPKGRCFARLSYLSQGLRVSFSLFVWALWLVFFRSTGHAACEREQCYKEGCDVDHTSTF